MNERLKNNKFVNALPLILSFLLPVAVMIVIFMVKSIYPFGERSFLRTDLYHQYAPFFNEFADKLRTGESLFYSWDIGAGTNFVSLYSYYLASPLNWLLILVPHDYVIEFVTYSIVFKMGLSGLTFGYYLKKHNNVNSFGIPMFALFYALSGYLAAYSWNVMWMDCIWLFPLTMLGIERLVKEDKPFLYVITLGLSILSNYYISIMICIFMVLYFISLMITNPTHEKVTWIDSEGVTHEKVRITNYLKKIGNFFLYSGLAGGFAAITLLPEIYALKLTASSNTTFPETAELYFSIFEMLSRHMFLVNVHIKLDHWPNIYCGVAVFLFIPLYIMNKKINYKEKFMNFILVLFMLLSFSLNILNYIWHGFHYPNSLPARQSFIYIFLILMMCYQGFLGLKERTGKQIVGAACGAIAFFVLAQKLIESEDFAWYVFFLSILFIAFYALLAWLYNKRRVFVPLLIMLTLTLATLESAVNMTCTSVTTINRTNYMDFDAGAKELVSAAKETDGEQFYRFEKQNLRTKNDGAWLDYPSISTFSSMAYASMSAFYKTMGMEAATNAYSATGSTPLVQSLMGVKYILTMDKNFKTGSIYSDAKASGDVFMFENDSALPLAYMVPSSMEENWVLTSFPIDNQQTFIREATGVKGVYELLPMTPTGQSTKATVTQSGFYYTYVVSSNVSSVSVNHGEFSKTFDNLKRHYIMDLGWCEAGETIYMNTTDECTTLSVMTYRLDEATMKQALEILARQGMTIETFSDTYIKGTITAETDGTCLSTIAYDPGWRVFVDGEQVEYHGYTEKEALIAFDLPAGTHTIEYRYEPQGVRYGALLSALCIILIGLLMLLKKLTRKTTIEGIDLGPEGSLFADFMDEFYDEDDSNEDDISNVEEDEENEQADDEQNRITHASDSESQEEQQNDPTDSSVPDSEEGQAVFEEDPYEDFNQLEFMSQDETHSDDSALKAATSDDNKTQGEDSADSTLDVVIKNDYESELIEMNDNVSESADVNNDGSKPTDMDVDGSKLTDMDVDGSKLTDMDDDGSKLTDMDVDGSKLTDMDVDGSKLTDMDDDGSSQNDTITDEASIEATADDDVMNDSTADDNIMNDSTADDDIMNDSTTDDDTMNDSTADDDIMNDSTADDDVMNDSTADDDIIENSSAKEIPMDKQTLAEQVHAALEEAFKKLDDDDFLVNPDLDTVTDSELLKDPAKEESAILQQPRNKAQNLDQSAPLDLGKIDKQTVSEKDLLDQDNWPDLEVQDFDDDL